MTISIPVTITQALNFSWHKFVEKRPLSFSRNLFAAWTTVTLRTDHSCFEDLGGKFTDWFHACNFFFFFLKWRSARAYLFLSLGQDRSTVALWAEMTVAVCSLTSWVWAGFPEVPKLCLDSIVSPLKLHWVKGVCMFRCNLPTALLTEWPSVGFFTAIATAVTQRWNRHQIRVTTEC